MNIPEVTLTPELAYTAETYTAQTYTPPAKDEWVETDILRRYLVARRRAILAELAEIDRLLGNKKYVVDKR